MRSLVIAILLLGTSAAFSQVPGYMGRKFSIFLEANPTPALLVQNVNNSVVANVGDNAQAVKENRFAFNFRPQVTIEYLIHRDVSFGLSYSRVGVGTSRPYLEGWQEPDDTNFKYEGDALKGVTTGFHLKFYKFKESASIAPIGFYKTLSAYFTRTNSYDTKKSKTKIFRDDFKYPVASLGIGRQSMFANNFLLKTGFEVGWAFVPLNFASGSSSDWNIQEQAGYNVHKSLFGHYIFNINIAIGYLPF